MRKATLLCENILAVAKHLQWNKVSLGMPLYMTLKRRKWSSKVKRSREKYSLASSLSGYISPTRKQEQDLPLPKTGESLNCTETRRSRCCNYPQLNIKLHIALFKGLQTSQLDYMQTSELLWAGSKSLQQSEYCNKVVMFFLVEGLAFHL